MEHTTVQESCCTSSSGGLLGILSDGAEQAGHLEPVVVWFHAGRQHYVTALFYILRSPTLPISLSYFQQNFQITSGLCHYKPGNMLLLTWN